MADRETPAALTLGEGAFDGARPRRISILGATGSIGENTLDLVARTPGAFEVVALTAQSNAARLAQLAKAHRAKIAVIGDPSRYLELKEALAGSGIDAAAGEAALEEAGSVPADCIMAAIVGYSFQVPT